MHISRTASVSGATLALLLAGGLLAGCTAADDAAENPPATSGQASDDVAADVSVADGTRAHPFPIGHVIEGRDWTVKVNSVTLDGNAAVAAANQFNDAPEAGHQYLIVNATVTYTGDDTGMPAEVGISYVTADGVTVNSYDSLVVAPDPLSSIDELYTGGSATGNVVLEVPTATADQGVVAVRAGMIADKVFVAVK